MLRKRRSLQLRATLLVVIVTGLLPAIGAQTRQVVIASPLPSSSFFGMDLYITGLERPKEEKTNLMDAAQDLGVQWSREEMSWANLEPDRKNTFNWGAYDPWINELVRRGINIVGDIQTTPSWASGVSASRGDWYWHVPNNPQDFIDFTAAAAQHYAGKIDTWEIWNEEDVESTFICNTPGCNRAAIYAQMLAGSYAAIKNVNPAATVLIGGLSIHDVHDAGMAFLDQVVAASGGKLNFDVLSIHPYMPDRPPESTDPNTVVQNFPYRLDMSYKWLQQHGAPNKEIWVTEDGYSTCTCDNKSLGVSEAEQARRLVRLNVLAMAAPNVTQFDFFQIKDKFNSGPGDMFGNMAIMRNDLSHKPAYNTYKTLTGIMAGATYLGQGTLMHAVQNRWQPQYDVYHYKFTNGGRDISVIWKIGAPQQVTLPLSQATVKVMDDYGKTVDAPVNNGMVTLTISEDPIYVIEQSATPTGTLDPSTDNTSPTGFRPSQRFASYWQNNGALSVFGYAISGERAEKSPTDGKTYVVQYFERARFEYHPEYAGTANEVLLGLLGTQAAKGRKFPSVAPPQDTASLCFKETGHCIWGTFLDRWRKLGLSLVGLPISDQFQEKSTDGKTYWVQYFERERFEYHPENQAPYDVLLGLLGRQQYKP